MSAHQHRPRSSPQHKYRRALLLLLVFVAVFVGMLLFLDRSEEEAAPDSVLETVEIGGVTCVPRHNLRTYLFMGIDNTGEETEDYVYGSQCDTIRLVVVDETHNTLVQMPINRNTLTDVHTYDSKTGEDLGTSYIQISFAHATGGDKDGPKSCENVERAVSDLLYGQKIDGYLSLSMDGIQELNHQVGGVTVTIEDDFSRADPSLVMGETVHLNDAQAEQFVRGRMSVGDGTNEGRMRRQNAYIEGLKTQMTEKIEADTSFAFDLFDALGPYMVTDMSKKEFGRIVNALVMYDAQEEVNLKGTVGTDELEFATLELDRDSLNQAVIDLFYTRVED